MPSKSQLLSWMTLVESFNSLIRHYLARFHRKTITCDRGSEFAHYANIQKKSSCEFYFYDPYSPWQKGTNENTNGRIRRFLPRNTEILKLTQADIDLICKNLNNTPRKILNFRKPREDILRAVR